MDVFYVFICIRIKKDEIRGGKCHGKTVMSGKSNEALQQAPNMCRLNRSRRKKNEGRG